MGAYVAQVDRVLGAGQELFAASTGPARGLVDGRGPAVPAPPANSGTSVGAADAGEGYRHSWRGLTGLDSQTNDTADQGVSEAQRGRTGALSR